MQHHKIYISSDNTTSHQTIRGGIRWSCMLSAYCYLHSTPCMGNIYPIFWNTGIPYTSTKSWWRSYNSSEVNISIYKWKSTSFKYRFKTNICLTSYKQYLLFCNPLTRLLGKTSLLLFLIKIFLHDMFIW